MILKESGLFVVRLLLLLSLLGCQALSTSCINVLKWVLHVYRAESVWREWWKRNAKALYQPHSPASNNTFFACCFVCVSCSLFSPTRLSFFLWQPEWRADLPYHTLQFRIAPQVQLLSLVCAQTQHGGSPHVMGAARLPTTQKGTKSQTLLLGLKLKRTEKRVEGKKAISHF